MRRALSVLAALLAAAAWAGCASDEPAAPAMTSTIGAAAPGSVMAACFTRLPAGWSSFGSGPVTLTRRGAVTATYATSWDYQTDAHGPAGVIPDDGTMISVLLLRRADEGRPAAGLCVGVLRSRSYPPLGSLPRHLSDMDRGQLEGRPDVTEYRTLASRGNDYRVEVRVDLSPHADRHDAARALAALKLPHWGARC